MAGEKRVERWTYIGRRPGQKNTLVHGYLTPDGERFYRKALYAAGVGALIDVTVDEDSVYMGGEHAPKWVGPAEASDALKIEWAAADRAAVGAAEAQKQAKALDPFADVLEGLREQYRRMPAPQRAALLTAIIREVTR